MNNSNLNMNPGLFGESYWAKAEQVFLRPFPQLNWDEIVPRAVAGNTFRGFHRIDTTLSGAKKVFERYFVDQRERLIRKLASIASREDLHRLSNGLCRAIRDKLDNVKLEQLSSYNKVRKPVDLYLEHLVGMAIELEGTRDRLTQFLFLPMDNWILADPNLFSKQELAAYRLTRKSTYKDVVDESTYLALQAFVSGKAKRIAKDHRRLFHVIYFDLIWNNRFQREGGNLFETNPVKPKARSKLGERCQLKHP